MTKHIDNMLDFSAPIVNVDTPGVERELYALSVAAEVSMRRTTKGRRRRNGTFIAAVVLLASGATAAVAAPAVHQWTMRWAPDAMFVIQVTANTSCEMKFKVGGLDAAGSDAARTYIASIDLSTISVDEAVQLAAAQGLPLSGRNLAEKRAAAVSAFVVSSTNSAILQQGFPDSTLTIDEEMLCFKVDKQ